MQRSALPLLLLLATGCEGRLIESNLPGGNQPPTTNAALAFRFGGPGSDLVAGLLSDAAGNLYMAGTFTGSANFDPGSGLSVLNSLGGADGFLAKYSPSGGLLWARRFGGPSGDQVSSLAVDLAGNVYAVGSFSGQANTLPVAGPTILSDGTPNDGFVLALDPAGTVRWALPLGGNQDDAARAVSLSSTGNLIVAGSFHGSADFSRNGAPTRLVAQGGADAFLASYSSPGVLQWARDIGGLGEETVALGGLSPDAQGGAALLGSFSGAVDFDPGPGSASRNSISGADVFLARYDAGGNFSSVVTVGGLGSVTGIKALLDQDGSALVTGWFKGAIDFDPGTGTHTLTSLGQNGATDAFVARYSATGSFLWVSSFGEFTTVADRSNSGTALALDPADQPLVAGRFFGSPDFDPGNTALRLTSLGQADAFLVKLTAGGALATTP